SGGDAKRDSIDSVHSAERFSQIGCLDEGRGGHRPAFASTREGALLFEGHIRRHAWLELTLRIVHCELDRVYGAGAALHSLHVARRELGLVGDVADLRGKLDAGERVHMNGGGLTNMDLAITVFGNIDRNR